MRTLKHWCQLLTQLHPDHLPVHQHYTVSTLPPGSPQLGSADSEWQQLSVARLDTAPTKLPVTVPTHALSRPHQTALYMLTAMRAARQAVKKTSGPARSCTSGNSLDSSSMIC